MVHLLQGLCVQMLWLYGEIPYCFQLDAMETSTSFFSSQRYPVIVRKQLACVMHLISSA